MLKTATKQMALMAPLQNIYCSIILFYIHLCNHHWFVLVLVFPVYYHNVEILNSKWLERISREQQQSFVGPLTIEQMPSIASSTHTINASSASNFIPFRYSLEQMIELAIHWAAIDFKYATACNDPHLNLSCVLIHCF